MIKRIPGANDAAERIKQMTEQQLLDVIDSLFGRKHLKFGDGLEEIRAEAIRQSYADFEDLSEATPAELARHPYFKP
jgi:hypothetical protein